MLNLYISLTILLSFASANKYLQINLPDEHLSQYFFSYPTVKESCSNDSYCPYKSLLNSTRCWGYEDGCTKQNIFARPSCPGDHRGWVKDKNTQVDTFFTQGDFGYVKEQRDELQVICAPTFAHDSSLECSQYLRFCRARNIMINFSSLSNRKEPVRYHMDVLSEGEIGGHCAFNSSLLTEKLEHHSPLQSWAPELKNFRDVSHIPGLGEECDINIDRPTFFMKIDATVNMYHHFCDFVNLYTSLHVNSSHPDAFSTDVHLMIWETYPYSSQFAPVFKAFTKHPVWDLNKFQGKTVCFRNAVFPLLPRMVYGLYYNTPLIQGCEKSALFEAFSKFVLHRLNITKFSEHNTLPFIESEPELQQNTKMIKNKTINLRRALHEKDEYQKLRITLLSRDTKYRRILNEDELLHELKKDSRYIVKKVVFNRVVTFPTQLSYIIETDVLIGMHGAGLTHMLFLPQTSAVFELYNCEDAACYRDLARLKGIKYITWQDPELVYKEDEGHHPDGGSHPKFTNYSFDIEEFVRLVSLAANHVLEKNKIKSVKKLTLNTFTSHDEL